MAESQLEVKDPGAKSALDIVDLFKDDDKDDKKVVKEDKKEKEEKEDTEDKDTEEENKDTDEIELVDADEEAEKLDLTSEDDDKIDITAPPRKKEILKKYPELFKDFPFMEKILYRDRQYTELFGSFDDAKEIADRSETFNEFESQLLSGKTDEILKNVKDTDPKAFDKIVDNYLLTLHSVDKEAYFDVVNNLNKRLIIEMVKEAKESENQELNDAAVILNQFLFGSSKFIPVKTRTSEKPDEAKEEAEKERLSFIQERFETSRDDLQNQVDNTLKATISEYIDPRNNMTAYVKKNAVADALRLLNSSISSDPSVKNTIDKLWRAAFDAKFSKDSLGKIKSFYLGKAKANLPNAIKKARSEALKDLSPRKEDKEVEETDESSTRQRKGPITAGRPSSQTSKGGMKKGESVSDFFARD